MKLGSLLMTTALVALTSLSAAHAEDKELNIYNWTDYTSPELLEKFTKETGIKVTVDTYDSNETLLAKLKAGGAGYDIAVASSDFVPVFVSEGLVEKIGVEKLPISNLDERWRSVSWDPKHEYSVPWDWGTTSYMIDTAVYKGPIDSLKTLFEPPAELAGKISMFSSPTEVASLALTYLGLPQCNTNPADLKKLQALLLAQKPAVKMYNSDGIQDRLASGEVVIAQDWSGDAFRARQKRASLTYVYPKEGLVAWMDNVVIPKGAKHPEAAKAFVAFMLKPENAALQSNFSGYLSGVTGADKFYSAEMAAAPELKVPDGVKLAFAPACPEKAIKAYDKIWTDLRK